MQILESKIERQCKLLAKEHGCLLLKIEKQRGWPDRLLVCPNGSMMFLEFKRPGGSLSPLQSHTFDVLRSMNVSVEEVDNQILFLALLQSRGVPMSTKKEASSG
jgi:hypothetical protein